MTEPDCKSSPRTAAECRSRAPAAVRRNRALWCQCLASSAWRYNHLIKKIGGPRGAQKENPGRRTASLGTRTRGHLDLDNLIPLQAQRRQALRSGRKCLDPVWAAWQFRSGAPAVGGLAARSSWSISAFRQSICHRQFSKCRRAKVAALLARSRAHCSSTLIRRSTGRASSAPCRSAALQRRQKSSNRYRASSANVLAAVADARSAGSSKLPGRTPSPRRLPADP